MTYQEKLQYAEQMAKALESNKPLEDIKSQLRHEGLYDRDISEVMATVQNVLIEKHQEKIKEHLLTDKNIMESDEFKSLDSEILRSLVVRERQSLAVVEKRKITKLVKKNESSEKILSQVDTRFLTFPQASEHLEKVKEVYSENRSSTRFLSIAGGIGLLLLTVILLFAINRVFYVLPIFGLVLIVKGLFPERPSYND